MNSRLRELAFLLFCAVGVFFSYLVYGIIQEKLTKSNYGDSNDSFNYFFSMLLFQCLANTAFSAVALTFTRESRGEVAESKFALCGFTYIGAMFASNFSLKFVSYPTQVVSKSIKPIPVMILNVILAKRKYPLQKYLFVTMISLGVMMFMYKNNVTSTGNFFGGGECLLLISLLLDGITGGVEESLSKHKIGSYTLMFRMNMWSVVYLICALIATGEGTLFIQFAQKHPIVLYNLALFGLTSAVGQIFLFTLLTNFGSLMCSIVTTTRKFFTVLVSIILFDHVMTTRQWIGTVLIFSGIFLDQLYGKSAHKTVHGKSHAQTDREMSKKRAETKLKGH
ncbi:Solute carrier 35 member B1 [Clonorchis sinensis]|uniref:Solute carrier 35 member B1 n=2 Tax=Clonorchis sinensis TaxID=79923 RepID=A0A8T1MNT6_CLOSI|nr:Solute carrier 35 member B1 [Clonorchis sinensis]